MKRLINGVQVVCGLTLLLLYLTDVVSEVPWSIFTVLLGGGLVVDGARGLLANRGKRE
ncbi:hypothetical protein ACFZCL_35575 [Streptomyces sp. NPDC008159]|uniref:hypothetical protein n=1 Tax=Streptomyces sp. NPDC008159 TaxID=3364817 RepID=UPI0036EF668F